MTRVINFMLIALLGVAGCSARFGGNPVEDKNVGLTESQVVKKYGEPTMQGIKPANEFRDELGSPIRAAFSEKPFTLIKELYYQKPEGELIFWLVKEDAKWIVYSDISIPKGVEF